MKTPRLQGPDFLALAKSQLMEEIDKVGLRKAELTSLRAYLQYRVC